MTTTTRQIARLLCKVMPREEQGEVLQRLVTENFLGQNLDSREKELLENLVKGLLKEVRG